MTSARCIAGNRRLPLAAAAALIVLAHPTAWTTAPGTTPPTGIVSDDDMAAFKARVLTGLTGHLDSLLGTDGTVSSLKGKSADGMTALAFFLVYECNGNRKYRAAAVELADRILHAMRSTKHGVLYIKEKETPSGETISGGGPPPFAWYTSAIAYVFHKEGGRQEDIKYIARVFDNFAWNENGWWANDVNIDTGEPKAPLSKAGAINKNATMAMAAGMLSCYVRQIDPALADRLRAKADKCIHQRILPAQASDGFWHYGLMGNDPKEKDVLGYFMLTTGALIQMRQFTGSYCDAPFQDALDKACAFALREIAPMTDPNSGSPCSSHRTPETPAHYNLADEPKRGFALAYVLFGGRHFREGMKIMDYALTHFPGGDSGQDGAHATFHSALVLFLMQQRNAAAAHLP